MNLFFSLEKASSFSPPPGPATLVVLEPAATEEAVADSGAAAASASLRLSLIVATLGSQADAAKEERSERVQKSVSDPSTCLIQGANEDLRASLQAGAIYRCSLVQVVMWLSPLQSSWINGTYICSVVYGEGYFSPFTAAQDHLAPTFLLIGYTTEMVLPGSSDAGLY